MGRLKTFIPALFVGVTLASPVSAGQTSPDELVRIFADCAGRYSALREHLWMWDGPASEQASDRYATFGALLEAAMPYSSADGPRVLGWRIASKTVHRQLLDRMRLDPDTKAKHRAGKLAAQAIQRCDRLLLGL